jgi:hypothetical protein
MHKHYPQFLWYLQNVTEANGGALKCHLIYIVKDPSFVERHQNFDLIKSNRRRNRGRNSMIKSFPQTLGNQKITSPPSKKHYAALCNLPRAKHMAVNPRYTTSRVESHTVNIRLRTCRICDPIRHVVVFRRESVVLQVSNKFVYFCSKTSEFALNTLLNILR